MVIHIRQEEKKDIAAIRKITTAAFALAEHSNQKEADIIDALRTAAALTLSLVAEQNDEIVGHIAFSPVLIDGETKGWYGLGPVSVRPDCQKTGIGSQLIREGLAFITEAGAKGCVVLGEPDYYKRFGFENDEALVLEGVPAEYFMRLVLSGSTPKGIVTYHKGFYV